VWGCDRASRIYIVDASLLVNGETRYKAVLSVDEDSIEVLGCAELLRELLGVVDKPHQLSKLGLSALSAERLWISSVVQNYLRTTLLARGVEDVERYADNTASRGLRGGSEWNRVLSLDDIEFELSFLGY